MEHLGFNFRVKQIKIKLHEGEGYSFDSKFFLVFHLKPNKNQDQTDQDHTKQTLLAVENIQPFDFPIDFQKPIDFQNQTHKK